MFQPLIHYLFQYGQVSIPAIGRFDLVRQPAVLDVAGKVAQPPSWSTRFAPLPQGGTAAEGATEHQLVYLAGQLHTNTASAAQMLEDFGVRLEKTLGKGPFHWKGLGTLERSGAAIAFHPDELNSGGLQPVPAERALRENVSHTVLVGDREISSGPPAEAVAVPPARQRQRPYLVIAAWVLVVLAFLFVLLHFSRAGFHPGSAGNQEKIKIETPQPTYKKE